jgi:hypothetical protein
MTAVVNPKRFKVSARMEAQTVLVLRKSMGIKELQVISNRRMKTAVVADVVNSFRGQIIS